MLNIRETAEQKIYITSDPHLGHKQDFVFKARGYDSQEAHDEGVIGVTNEIVRPTDILLMLGDFCLNTTKEQFDALLARINCQNIYALWGNHNNPHQKNVYIPMVKHVLGEHYAADAEVYPLRYKNMVYFGNYLEAILDGQYTVMMHYPISVWNEMQHGAWMLCGHSHNQFPQSKADNLYGKILDVGWDGHGKPWSLAEIQQVMDSKRFIAQDHHE